MFDYSSFINVAHPGVYSSDVLIDIAEVDWKNAWTHTQIRHLSNIFAYKRDDADVTREVKSVYRQ